MIIKTIKFKVTSTILAIGYLLLLLGGCSQSIEQEERLNNQMVYKRLTLTAEEFAGLFKNKNDYSLYKEINRKYQGSYIPQEALSAPHEINVVSRGITEQKQEIESEKAMRFLLSKNNILQIENYVLAFSKDLSSAKLLYASDYDKFISSKPKNINDIPKNIILKEAFINNSILLTKTRSESDKNFPYAECAYCLTAALVTGCTGFPPGLLELGSCVICAIKLMEYYDCN